MNEWGERRPCAVCGGTARADDVADFRMTHGVVVLLCTRHRRPEYLRRGGGRALTKRLAAIWVANGISSLNRFRALEAHHVRVTSTRTPRHRPGSYAWPRLRRDAEKRFAAGENVRTVIHDLRYRHRNGFATVPSARTMRRWFAEGRWLRPVVTTPAPPTQPPRNRPLPSRFTKFGPYLTRPHPFYPFNLLFNDDG